MTRIPCLALILALQAGCASEARRVEVENDWDALIASQESREVCDNIFRSRLHESMTGVPLGGGKDAVVGTILTHLPAEEREAVSRAARRLRTLGPAEPDSKAIPEVMSALAVEMEAAGICPGEGATTSAIAFADQLNLILMRAGLDTDALVPPNDDWPGMQTLARLMVALVVDVQRDPLVYLPQIVAIDDKRVYPDGLRLGKQSPASLAGAVDALLEALPKVDAVVVDRTVCSFKDIDAIERGLEVCSEAACQSLPVSSRDRGCGYLVRLADWVEVTWLGGLCRSDARPRTGELAEWFRRRGVKQCHQMSEAISISLAQAMVGDRQEPGSILRALKTAP